MTWKQGRAWGLISRGAAGQVRKVELCPQELDLHAASPTPHIWKFLVRVRRKMCLSAALNYCFNKLAQKLTRKYLKIVKSTYNCSGQASIHFVLEKQDKSWERELPALCMSLIIRTATRRKINTSCILIVPPGQTVLMEPLARNTQKGWESAQKWRGSRTTCNSVWKVLCSSQKSLILITVFSTLCIHGTDIDCKTTSLSSTPY